MTPTQQEATYRAALELVARIDEDLCLGTGHYYTKSGLLLYSLDQVVNSVLTDSLEVDNAHNHSHPNQPNNLLPPQPPLPPSPAMVGGGLAETAPGDLLDYIGGYWLT